MLSTNLKHIEAVILNALPDFQIKSWDAKPQPYIGYRYKQIKNTLIQTNVPECLVYTLKRHNRYFMVKFECKHLNSDKYITETCNNTYQATYN